MADQTNQLRVRLVTPERTLFEADPADAVELPAKNGYMEVLYGHAPLLAELGAGDVTVHGGTASGEAAATTEPNDPLQRELGICGSAARSRDHPRQRRAQARGDRRAARRAAARPRSEDVEAKPAKAKRPTTRRSASSPKPKRRLRRRARASRLTDPNRKPFTKSPAPTSRAFGLLFGSSPAL